MASDIIVKISADAKQFNDAIDDIKSKTQDLEESLGSVAKVSGLVFGALVGSAGLALKAFGEADKSSKELTIALQNQGLAAGDLSKKYKEYATTVSKATGIDDDALVSAQAKLQNFIGQTEVTENLTQAIADLSTQTGSLESASDLLGKAYQGNTRALKQMGIVVDENASAQERLEQAAAAVNQRFGGQAAAAATGVGAIKKLEVSFGNLLENIGERLAPAFEKGVNALTKFIDAVNTPEILDFAVAIGEVIAAFAGGIATIAGAGLAFIKLQQAAEILSIGIKALGLTARGALLASGIGALIVVATLVVEHWDSVWPRAQAVFVGAMVTVVEAARGVGKILSGVLLRDLDSIQEGFEQFKGSLSKGISAGKITLESELKRTETGPTNEEVLAKEQKLLADKKALADKAAAERVRLDDLNAEQNQNAIDIALEQASAGSEEVIKLKQQENEILKQLETEKNKDIIDALEQRLGLVEKLEEDAEASAVERDALFKDGILAKNAEFQKLDADQQELFLAKEGLAVKNALLTEDAARTKFLADKLKKQVDSNNQFLADKEQFNVVYAALNQAQNSTEVQGFAKGVSQLTALQNSKNKELKTIGKAAAVADITIKTAQAALAAYAGFAAIPIVGIPLGIAAAAAVVAFGAEQIGTVLSAQKGGVVPGANFGGDSIPALLQPGELVVPRASANDVLNTVSAQRDAQSVEASSGVSTGAGAAGSSVVVDLRFSGDNAEKFLTAKQVESRSLGILREGA